MRKEDLVFARELIKSINCGLDKMEKGSQVERTYLQEKVKKLHSLMFYESWGVD